MSSKTPVHSRGSDLPWDDEKLYFKGDDYFEDVLNAIRRSKRRVDFEVYIFRKGVLGDRIAAALLRAARRGVRVRLLVDGIGSPDFAADYGSRLKKGGVRSRVYRLFPPVLVLFSRFFGSLIKGRVFQRLGNFLTRMNRRDHRKLVLVDRVQVWLGGFNVVDEHLESIAGRKAWRDTGLGLSGVRDRAFGLAFNTAWNDKVHRRLWRSYRDKLIAWLSRRSSGDPVHINVTRKLRSRFHKELLGRLGSVRRRIWVTTPYFVPTLPLFRALFQSAKGGLDVRLVLPGRSDIPFVRWASMTFFPALLKAGCRIFEYRKSILHAKTLIADDWALVGSSNFNHRSFLHDLEVDVATRRPDSLRALRRQYASDFRQSREVLLTDLEFRPLWIRSLTLLFFQLRRWL